MTDETERMKKYKNDLQNTVKRDVWASQVNFTSKEGKKSAPQVAMPKTIQVDAERISMYDRVTPTTRRKARKTRRETQPTTSIDADKIGVGSYSAALLGAAIRGEYQYGKLGLILGLATIIGGVVLGLNGVAGSTSWTAKFLGLESSVNDAAPGVVLFIVGIFLVRITKPKIKLSDLNG